MWGCLSQAFLTLTRWKSRSECIRLEFSLEKLPDLHFAYTLPAGPGSAFCREKSSDFSEIRHFRWAGAHQPLQVAAYWRRHLHPDCHCYRRLGEHHGQAARWQQCRVSALCKRRLGCLYDQTMTSSVVTYTESDTEKRSTKIIDASWLI